MKRLKVKICLGILLLLTGVRSPCLLQSVEAQEFPAPQRAIQQMLEAERKVDFVGNRLVISFSRWRNVVLEERVTNKSPDKQRVEVLVPSEMAGFTAVRSGKQRYDNPAARKCQGTDRQCHYGRETSAGAQ